MHLLGIFLAREKKTKPHHITKVIGEVVTHRKNIFSWLEPPKSLGAITISEVWGASTLSEHEALVHDWADSIWQSWEKNQADIKKLLEYSSVRH